MTFKESLKETGEFIGEALENIGEGIYKNLLGFNTQENEQIVAYGNASVSRGFWGSIASSSRNRRNYNDSPLRNMIVTTHRIVLSGYRGGMPEAYPLSDTKLLKSKKGVLNNLFGYTLLLDVPNTSVIKIGNRKKLKLKVMRQKDTPKDGKPKPVLAIEGALSGQPLPPVESLASEVNNTSGILS